MTAYWLWPYAFALALVGGWVLVVVPGWRRVRAERRDGWAAVKRLGVRASERSWE